MAKHVRGVVALVLLSLVLGGCARQLRTRYPNPYDRLRNEIDQILADPSFANAHWGVVIQSLNDGRYLYMRNAYKGFMPASNMKLFTTATAIAKLGPDYTYTTLLYRNGQITDSTLQGDLIIQGTGDPSISARFHDGDPLAVFRNWVDSLRAHGIAHIRGRIVGDDNWFIDEIMGAGWAWDYQSDWYAAQISALSFNDNCMDIIFTPGKKPGDPVQYRLIPDTKYVHVNCQVKTVRPGLEEGVFYHRKRATNDVTITGSLPAGGPPKHDWFSVENPTKFTAFVFREYLEKHGIDVQGEAVDIDELGEYAYEQGAQNRVATYISPPMSEIVRVINKVSQNLYAELVLRTLGKHFTDVGDAKHGIQVVKDFMAQIGNNPNFLIMLDGSGLSRYDMVQPKQIVTLLRAMRRHPNGQYFYESLPIAGVDGSLRNRMVGTAAQGNVRAKTGYIENVRTLSGYVTTADGEELAFSLMANNYTVPTSMANLVQDLICERLANFSRREPWEEGE